MRNGTVTAGLSAVFPSLTGRREEKKRKERKAQRPYMYASNACAYDYAYAYAPSFMPRFIMLANRNGKRKRKSKDGNKTQKNLHSFNLLTFLPNSKLKTQNS